ncbi:Hypothetical predicted protein [Cloeon dipterum]|uniref:tRNA pseudouridine synthase n=1 Tax=Cloeon dipterum TaxID=197152 RepID=A0A8S1DQ54_9INSE|nr:Hypothetical predicted protein [Cloeon dipterum]
MVKYFFNLAYIGTNLRGVSKNVQEISQCFDSNSVAGLLELALARLFPSQPDVYISSRTDAGVHAINSSAHFRVKEPSETQRHSCYSIANEVNRYFLKNQCDIRVSDVRIVPEEFHARHSAQSRSYLYRFAVIKPEAQCLDPKIYGKHFHPTPIVENNRCYFVFNSIFDYEKVQKAAEILIGNHDFATFMSKPTSLDNIDKNTVRSVYKLEVRPGTPFISSFFDPVVENWNYWELFCHGKSFLYKQVRRFLSTLITVGQGRISIEDVQRMIDEPGKDSWSSKIFLVPSHGLYLLNVEYNPEDFIFKQENGDITAGKEEKIESDGNKGDLQ